MLGQTPYFTKEDVILAMRKFIAECIPPTQVEAAKRVGVSPAYFNDVIRGNTTLSAAMAEKFGFRKEENLFTKLEKKR